MIQSTKLIKVYLRQLNVSHKTAILTKDTAIKIMNQIFPVSLKSITK